MDDWGLDVDDFSRLWDCWALDFWILDWKARVFELEMDSLMTWGWQILLLVEILPFLELLTAGFPVLDGLSFII